MSFSVSRLLARARLARCGAFGLLGFLCPALSYAEVPPVAVVEPLDRPALVAPQALTGVFLDIARAGDRLVAVGERGDIVLSDDNGTTWRQVETPTSVTLDALTFVDDKTGWAAGHSGIVLHTTDGGETWTKQFDGLTAAKMAHDDAQANATAHPDDADAKAYLKNAEYLVSDGADKPFLDVYFTDKNNGFIVGAYGLFFHTTDGGASWKAWLSHVPNTGARHLTAIAGKGNLVYLAGEQGLLARSRDGGQSFERLTSPYNGAFFEVMILPDNTLVVAGLRGNAFWSADEGATFTKVQNVVPVSFNAGLVASDGTLYLTNQAGLLLWSFDKGHTLSPVPLVPGAPMIGLAQAADGGIVATAFDGVRRLPVKQNQKAGE